MAKKRKEDAATYFRVSASQPAKKRAVVNFDSVSTDGRRLQRETHTVYTFIEPRHARLGRPLVQDLDEGPSDHLGVDDNAEAENIEAADLDTGGDTGGPASGSATFATVTHDPVLLNWTLQRGMFLNELLRLEGLRGADISRCRTCGMDEEAPYLCIDCFGGDHKYECRSCCLSRHAASPFHRVKMWNGQFLQYTTLRDIGLHIQLGHPDGEPCPVPHAAPSDFVVLHTNGLHPTKLSFCGCDRVHLAGTRVQQLLRFELYPATLKKPKTCCTLRLLEHFHILTLQSKINAYDFYLSLVKISDNTGTYMRYHRLKAFLRMVREYRHLKMLKRAGRGHEEGGISSTPSGGLAILCPGCPRPGVNLPDDWMSISADKRYIYWRFTAQDASFKHKRRMVSNEERDPALGSGLGYFVEDTEYRKHLARFVNEEEISTCTGLAALLQANTRWMSGYVSTGIGLVCCSRHGFVLPNGVGDLQKGERYCNMDYVFCAQAQHSAKEVEEVNSYDIMCQWEKKLRQRISRLPDNIQINLDERKFCFLIPKYHWRAHKEEGHNVYSFYVRWGVGNTDGEEIERLWWSQDATAGSTREMGPGSRHDTLEDHFGWRNWQKLVGLGPLLKKRLKKAVAQHEEYGAELESFTADVMPEKMEEWVAEVVAWEQDPSLDDPYFIAPSGMTEGEVRLRLAQEDDMRAATGNLSLHEVTPASMLALLLDLEDQQRRFRLRHPRTRSGSAQQAAAIVEQRTKLRHRIAKVGEIQAIYMPGVATLRAQWEQQQRRMGKDDQLAEEQRLFFPSELDRETLRSCTGGLEDIERQLCDAQLRSSLDRLRVQLQIKSRLTQNKHDNVRHQKNNTRANSRIKANEERIRELADRYRDAWRAKDKLDGDGDWKNEWRVLHPSDVRGLPKTREDPRQHRAARPGKEPLSWIWQSAGNEGSDSADLPGMQEVIRVQWLRARAQVMRCEEEVNILTEEQRRVLVTLEHDARRWDAREAAVDDKDLPDRQGAAAYAAEQAALCRRLRVKFARLWKNKSVRLSGEEDCDSDSDKDTDDGCDDEDSDAEDESASGELQYTYMNLQDGDDSYGDISAAVDGADFMDDYYSY